MPKDNRQNPQYKKTPIHSPPSSSSKTGVRDHCNQHTLILDLLGVFHQIIGKVRSLSQLVMTVQSAIIIRHQECGKPLTRPHKQSQSQSLPRSHPSRSDLDTKTGFFTELVPRLGCSSTHKTRINQISS